MLSNLLRNARVHTPAGTPIELSVRANGAGAVLAVRDHGPGLPTGDPAELFERFWRRRGRPRPRPRGRRPRSVDRRGDRRRPRRARAADAEGGGAHFEITLPLRVAAYTRRRGSDAKRPS